jgi:hypothetical protein
LGCAGITYATGAGTFSNSGGDITNRASGIVNNSSKPQRILNSVFLAAPQTWKAANGPLIFGGGIFNGGFSLTIDGGSTTTFASSAGLQGAGGLIKTGSGTLSVNGGLGF